MWLLITGTGRCGTGYIAQVLTSAGVNCSHEGLFNLEGWPGALDGLRARRNNPGWGWQAESSWLAAPFLTRPELDALTVVHLVRHPKRVMDSHLRLMLHSKDNRRYYDWMRQHLPELDELDELVDRAACWYLRINELVEKRADLFHKVEDPATVLLDRLGIDPGGRPLFEDTTYNSRPGYGPSDVILEDVSQPLRDQLSEMSGRYGYDWPTEPERVTAGWFGDRRVEISAPSAHIGGAFQLRDHDGGPVCYDAPLVQFFYNQVKDLDRPVVVDIGANTGNFALLGKLVPMILHCFEPNPAASRALRANLDINGVQAQVYDVALADRDGDGELVVPVDDRHAAVAMLADGTFRRDLEVRRVRVEVRRLDSYDLPRVDALKVDVEGAELPVLRGAERTIERDHPGILVEYAPDNTRQFGYEPGDVMDWLKGRGYDQFRRVGLEDLWAEVSP